MKTLAQEIQLLDAKLEDQSDYADIARHDGQVIIAIDVWHRLLRLANRDAGARLSPFGTRECDCCGTLSIRCARFAGSWECAQCYGSNLEKGGETSDPYGLAEAMYACATEEEAFALAESAE